MPTAVLYTYLAGTALNFTACFVFNVWIHRLLVPQPGIEQNILAVRGLSPNQTTGLPGNSCFSVLCFVLCVCVCVCVCVLIFAIFIGELFCV